MDDEDEAAILLAGLSGKQFEDFEDSIFSNIDKGDQYEWDAKPKVRFRENVV